MRSATVAGIAVVVAVTGGVAGHALRPGAEQSPAGASPTRSASTAPTSPSGAGNAWVPTPAPPGLASTTLNLEGSTTDTSGLTSTDTPTVPVYLLNSHTERTGDIATIAKALGMTRREPGGTPVKQSEIGTSVRIYDADASLGIDPFYPQPYLVFNDAQRGPGCLPQLRACTPSTAAAPTGDAAVKQLRRVMTDLGFDTDSFVLTAQSLPTATPSTLVWALPAVDGNPLDESILDELGVQYLSGGATWSATVTADGIVRLEAELIEITEVDTVQTLSPLAAETRMAEPAFIVANFDRWRDWVDWRGQSAPLTPGAAIPWVVHREVATHAAQTWSVRDEGDGRSIALPAWRYFTGDDSGPDTGWTAISAPDTALRVVSRVEYRY